MTDPIALFSEWYAEARAKATDPEPTAMTLATVSKDGKPSARVVLLKAHDARGFVFYTNMQSRKSQELQANPYAALCFNWIVVGKQVRVEGKVARVSEKEADDYFASRPLTSRIGAIASDQSRPLDAQATLERKVAALTKTYSDNNPPPRPAHWSGWRIVPQMMEFWQQGRFRLHERKVYEKRGDGWEVSRLYP